MWPMMSTASKMQKNGQTIQLEHKQQYLEQLSFAELIRSYEQNRHENIVNAKEHEYQNGKNHFGVTIAKFKS